MENNVKEFNAYYQESERIDFYSKQYYNNDIESNLEGLYCETSVLLDNFLENEILIADYHIFCGKGRNYFYTVLKDIESKLYKIEVYIIQEGKVILQIESEKRIETKAMFHLELKEGKIDSYNGKKKIFNEIKSTLNRLFSLKGK